MSKSHNVAVIIGVGSGLGASLAERFARSNLNVVMVARSLNKIDNFAQKIPKSIAYECDASNEIEVKKLFQFVENEYNSLDTMIYNVGGGFRNISVIEETVENYRSVWESSALGGFICCRAAASLMVTQGHGTILISGATASIRGSKGFCSFASGKFALRALSQSLAKEVGPKGVHVAHINIDGPIGKSADGSKLNPDMIADSYYNLYVQDRPRWTYEIDLRPWTEKW